LRIGTTGALEDPPQGVSAAPDLELYLAPTALPLALLGREAMERAVETRGDTGLAQTLRELSDAMPWFIERELAHWVGPIVARRLSALAGGLAAWPVYAGERVAASSATFLIEERHLLVKRAELDRFGDAIAGLRDDVARIEQRIARLSGKGT